MSQFDKLLDRIRSCTTAEKQLVFLAIRDSIKIHDLEDKMNVRAEVILGAIDRASDLTQRGVRGLIAETAFVVDIIPTLEGWLDQMPPGDLAYDACLRRGSDKVRVQVKMQRRTAGQPMRHKGSFCVEVQRTRTGQKDGISTRPYRYGEFDLLAVCMAASTGNWHDFMYTASSNLKPDQRDSTIIRTLQPVPEHPGDSTGMWTSELQLALDQIVSQR